MQERDESIINAVAAGTARYSPNTPSIDDCAILSAAGKPQVNEVQSPDKVVV